MGFIHKTVTLTMLTFIVGCSAEKFTIGTYVCESPTYLDWIFLRAQGVRYYIVNKNEIKLNADSTYVAVTGCEKIVSYGHWKIVADSLVTMADSLKGEYGKRPEFYRTSFKISGDGRFRIVYGAKDSLLAGIYVRRP